MVPTKNFTKVLILLFFVLNSCSKDSLIDDTSKIKMNVEFNFMQTFGICEKGMPLTEKNYIKLYIHSEAGKYNISTALINGYKFSATVEFTKEGDYEIILKGEGTPEKEQTDQFTITSNNDEISFKIQVLGNLSNRIIVASGVINFQTFYTYAVTGRDVILWKMEGAGGPSTVMNGIIYIRINSNLVAMNIETGQVIWTKNSFPQIEHITDDGNVLYISETAGILHALNPQNGNIIWTLDLPGYVIGSGFIVKNNVIYFGTDQLSAINSNGTVKWTTNYIQQVESTSVINDDRIFIRDDNSLYAVNLNTGDSIWSVKVQGMGSPVYYNGAVYLNSINGKTYCYDASKKNIIWAYEQSDLARSPFVYDNKVFVTTDFGFTMVTALDAQSGAHLWSCSGTFAQTDLIVSDSIAYIGTATCLTEIKQKTGETMFTLAKELGLMHSNVSVVYNKETKKAVYPN